MGASKRLAEMILQSLFSNQEETLVSIVRFGNVLNSSGSVVPLFRSQIKAGGPITVTHEDVTRYFMTASEAGELVIQAGALASDRSLENNNVPVYLLDMGEPIKIFDLACKMVELSGLTVYDSTMNEGDIDIKIVGLRPGEKLYEELLIGSAVAGTGHPKISIGSEVFPHWQKLEPKLLALEKSINHLDVKEFDKLLDELVFNSFITNSDETDKW
jgi:FlaA1/EpsC-like NDP-sugar epimerase